MIGHADQLVIARCRAGRMTLV